MLGTNPPAITSTATSLTITPIALASLGTDQTSLFYINIGGASGQFYVLSYEGATSGGPPSPASAYEVFRFSGTGAGQVFNSSPPASLVLDCTCATDANITSCSSGSPVSASIGLMSNEKPVIFSKEIEVK